MKVARVYLRVSTDEQDLTRQNSIIETARSAGFYIAGTYKEKASGARADRPELLRLIEDLQPGEIVIAEKLDRISRLPLDEAIKLFNSIKEKGARVSVPGLIDLSELADGAEGIQKIVIDSVQELIMKIALQTARDEYETRRERQKQGIAVAKDKGKYIGRIPDTKLHARIIELRKTNSIARTAELAGCSVSLVKKIGRLGKKKGEPSQDE